MNALELADALDWVCENHLVGIGDADFKATATMLRQQQSEIEALKFGKEAAKAWSEISFNYNEPVAWFYAYPDDIEEKFLCSNSELIETMKKKGYTLTPLYTHPVKELTDEEIRGVADEVFSKYKNWHHYQIDFARAIISSAR